MPSRRTERSRKAIRRGLVLGAVLACVACSAEHAFQGTNGYEPDDYTQIGTTTARPETGAVVCDGTVCVEASVDAQAPPDLEAGAAPTNDCAGARDIGTLSGDQVGPSLQATGTCSEWVKLRATENVGGISAAPMKLRVAVVSDDDADLYVYLNEKTDTLECSVPTASSASNGAGGTEIASVEWGETGIGANGSDDSRTVNVLVVFPRSVCSRNTAWTLTVDGDR